MRLSTEGQFGQRKIWRSWARCPMPRLQLGWDERWKACSSSASRWALPICTGKRDEDGRPCIGLADGLATSISRLTPDLTDWSMRMQRVA
jgi:hypothetical protein